MLPYSREELERISGATIIHLHPYGDTPEHARVHDIFGGSLVCHLDEVCGRQLAPWELLGTLDGMVRRIYYCVECREWVWTDGPDMCSEYGMSPDVKER